MESSSAKIVQLDQFRATRAGYEDVSQASVREVTGGFSQLATVQADFVEFYPVGDTRVTDSIAALRQVIEKIDEALVFQRDHDEIPCDDCLQQVIGALPDLFVRSRSIGDGFGAVVLATFHSVKNADGPLTERQLLELRAGLRKIAHAPYIDFNHALDIQEAYEGIGLDPDSREIGAFGGIIFSQGEGIR
jgi:hypothetical protein